MPSTDGNAKGTAAGRGNFSGVQPPFCSADDLKSVLSDIAAHIADADRRHTATLATMQERLQQLGREASELQAQLPDDFGGEFERVQHGMADLSARVTAATHERAVSAADAAADVWAAPSPMTGVASSGPAPLKSAVTQTATKEAGGSAKPGKSAGQKQPDPFEFAEHSVSADPQDPWDDNSARALVDLYDNGDAALPKTSIADDAARPIRLPDAVIEAAAAPATLASLAIGSSTHDREVEPAVAMHADRAWLESRFADIAERVEGAIANIKPDQSASALDLRFEEFEQRFDLAMQGVATRSDVDGLRTIEASIVELAEHLQQAQGELIRLEAIETQLVGLADRLSDDNLAELMSAASLSSGDVDRVANSVADRLGSRITGLAQTAPAGADRSDELRSLINRFVDDQQQSGEHTHAMLDTMQQAMIRMLDRMDQIEQIQAPSRPAASVAAHSAPMSAFAPMPMDPVDEASRPNLGAYRSTPERPAALDRPIQPATPSTAQPKTADHDHRPGDLHHYPDHPTPQHDRRAPPEPELRQQQAPRSREDFVAAARRAMRQAASESAVLTPETALAAVEPPSPAGKPAKSAGKTQDRFKLAGGMRPALMVGMIALLTIGGVLAAMTKMRSPSSSAAKVERRLVTPETEAAEKIAAPAEATTVQPKRTTAPSGAAAIAPNAAPGSSPAAIPAPAAPQNGSPAPSLRPKPETMIDELSSNATEGGELELSSQAEPMPKQASAPSEPLRGITIQQSSRLPTAQELIRAQERHRMATLSSNLGAAQPAAVVMPTALIPGSDVLAAQPDVAEAAGSGRSDMPPAMIGPNSLRLAAAKGDPSAEFEVAARFAEGKGVPQDFKQAITWYGKSAARGFAIAQYRLGTLYERGLGTRADGARAKIWYQRAAEQGNVKAMHNLAVLAAGRDQGAADYATSVRWFQEAAERGLADSQYNLAVLQDSGLGGPRDLKQAFVWLSLAAANGDKAAAKRRDVIAATLDPAGLKAAQALVEGWQPKSQDLMANDARAAGEAWKVRHAIQPNG